jgi:hypothetical protein
MDILDSYLKKNGCKIFKGKEALEIYRSNRESFEEICGSAIYDTLDGFMDNDDEDDDIKLIIVNSKEKPISVFYGTIENNNLSSDYTCSSELSKGGVLLRFYALLLANKENNNIQTLTGGISGGIPALLSVDSVEAVNEKRKKLSEYHVKNGAIINGSTFIYNLSDVQVKIVEMFGQKSGGQRRKTKKNRKRKRRARKSLKRKTRK